jgi:ABC-type uncharacterized transport system substrate-binding protein
VIDAAITLTSRNIDVFCQIPDNLTASSFSGIVPIAKKMNIPIFGMISEQARTGAIAVISRDYFQAGKDVIRQAMQVLNEEPVEEIPFAFVSRSELIINMESARFFHVDLPGPLVDTADIIIEKEDE